MPVFVDEAIYIHWSQGMWDGQRLRLLSLMDGKQPLFMLAVIPSLAIFQDPLFAGRFISVLAGFFTLLGIYLFSKEFLSKKCAVIASVLYIISPFTFFYDRLAVADGLLTALGVWSMYISTKLIKEKNNKLIIILGSLFALGLWTKTPAMFFIMLSFLTPFFFPLEKSKARYWKSWLIASLMGYGIYNLLRVSRGFWMIAKRNQDYVYSFKEVIDRGLINPLWPNFTASLSWMLSYLTIGIALVSLLGLLYVLFSKNKIGLMLFFWFMVPILSSSLISKSFTARYILLSIPILLIIASIFLERISYKLNKYLFTACEYLGRKPEDEAGRERHPLSCKDTPPVRAGRMSFILLLIIISVPALSFNFHLATDIENAPIPQRERSGYLEEWSSGYGIKEVSDYLIKISKEKGGAKIYAMTEGYVGTLPDGINIYTNNYKNIESFGIGWPVGAYPPNLNDYLKNGLVYLVVNESRMKLPSTDHLKLINKYPKPKGKNGQDFLLFYEYEKN